LKLKKRNRKFWIGMATASFVISWLLCGVLFSFDIYLPGELERAMARWEAQNVEDYRYRAGFSSPNSVVVILITVLDGRVALLEQYNSPFDIFLRNPPASPRRIDAAPDWYLENFSRSLPENLSYYTMDELFTFAEQTLQQHPIPVIEMCKRSWRPEMRFNAAQGYLEELGYNNCSTGDWGIGFMCGGYSSHCFTRVVIEEFEPLPDN
jgi:hypothetical protein